MSAAPTERHQHSTFLQYSPNLEPSWEKRGEVLGGVFAPGVSDKVVVMDDGAVVESGPPAQVIDNLEHARTKAFIEGAVS